MSKIAIFDLDGTLFHTLPDIYGALEYVLKKNGLDVPSEEQAGAFMGDGLKMFLQKVVSVSGIKECPQPVIDDYFSYYGAHCTDKTEPYDGIRELLDKLYYEKVKMAVVSNKSEFFVRRIVNHFGFDKYFIKISGGDTFHDKKPHPGPVLETIKALAPECAVIDAVMIGDSENDVAAGRSAGIKTCWCSYGYGVQLSAKPDFTASAPAEIYKYIINGE